MKTKEEIMHECSIDTLEAIKSGIEIFTKNECLEAMEQYATEQCKKLNIELSFAYGKIDKLNELIKAYENCYIPSPACDWNELGKIETLKSELK